MKITDEAKHAAYLAMSTCSMDDRVAAGQILEAAAPHLLADDTTSDGFHTVGELYQHRMLLTAALFRAWSLEGLSGWPQAMHPHKSWRHSDGELCFGGGWFIVVATLPTGQISYHYPAKDWDLFRIPELQLPVAFDGHTAADVVIRLERFLRPTNEPA